MKLAELCRQYTQEAVSVLRVIMLNKSAPPMARIGAATEILNRGWGRAPQTLDLTNSDGTLASMWAGIVTGVKAADDSEARPSQH